MSTENTCKLTDLIGEWKLSQKLMFLFVQFTYFMFSWESFHLSFLIPEVKFYCHSDFNSSMKDDACSKDCQQIVFDHKVFEDTLTEKLRLICDRAWLKSFSTTMLILGGMVANLIGGYLADRFGRRRIILLALIPFAVGILLSLFPPDYILFVIGVTLIGVAFMTIGTFTFVLLFEFCGEAQRSIAGVALELGYSLGAVALGGVAWALRHWFQIQLVNAGLVLILTIAWFLPESIEWLMKEGRNEEAVETVKKIMKVNGGPKMAEEDIQSAVYEISQLQAENSSSGGTESKSLKSLFASQDLRITTFCICYTWFANFFVFFGLSLNVDVFTDDIFFNFILSSATSVPSVVCVLFLLKFMSIKYLLITCNILSAVATFLYPLGQVLPWFKTVTIVLGWVMTGTTIMVLFSYTSELYPTEVRCKALGLGNFVARLGASLAPFIRELEFSTRDYVPMILFGGMCVLSAILALRLGSGAKTVDQEGIRTISYLSSDSTNTAIAVQQFVECDRTTESKPRI